MAEVTACILALAVVVPARKTKRIYNRKYDPKTENKAEEREQPKTENTRQDNQSRPKHLKSPSTLAWQSRAKSSCPFTDMVLVKLLDCHYSILQAIFVKALTHEEIASMACTRSGCRVVCRVVDRALAGSMEERRLVNLFTGFEKQRVALDEYGRFVANACLSSPCKKLVFAVLQMIQHSLWALIFSHWGPFLVAKALPMSPGLAREIAAGPSTLVNLSSGSVDANFLAKAVKRQLEE